MLCVQVIPKPGSKVMVVLGTDSGKSGTVVEVHKRSFKVEVELSSGGQHIFKEYEHVCKISG